MQVKQWSVFSLLEGTFLLDGGSMFGIVPKPLWEKRHPADERNRIVMALRPLLLRGPGKNILVDCGIGDRFDTRQQEIYQHQPNPGGLLGGLAALGLSAEDITEVIATHLHFDHVGGMLSKSAAGFRATFPNAKVLVQEDCWNWAQKSSNWDQGSFFEGDFEQWERLMPIQLLRGDYQIEDQLRVKVVSGHTPGQQIVLLGSGSETVVYCADLIPTATHLRLPYIMAYDQRPLDTLEEKKVLLAQALEEDWTLVFEHDPHVPACKLQEKKGQVVLGKEVCINLQDTPSSL